MKKFFTFVCIICALSTVVYATEDNFKRPDNPPPNREEMMKIKKAREAEFEQKLGLTEAQKAKAKELRLTGHEKMKPVMEELKAKKQEAQKVRDAKKPIIMQEAELTILDKQIAELEKKANSIRKQNMKDFESILTNEQKKILQQMKQEGRQRFEQKQRSDNMAPPDAR